MPLFSKATKHEYVSLGNCRQPTFGEAPILNGTSIDPRSVFGSSKFGNKFPSFKNLTQCAEKHEITIKIDFEQINFGVLNWN